ncbi:hypothetical protein NE237_004386 [Protea cynaroides]|uniref:BHLH domain-containing protein n=1 Tax=Protea cynaroides TaxID=273540 RepID=A0A9Q0KIP1_9MAGN|nr:hypothetical protein NE237_004386 [Protea cynaroides]
MLTDSPFSTLTLPFEVPMNHNQQKTGNESVINSCNHRETESSESFPLLPDTEIVKKLSHNASERDRRKRLNDLFFSLRSLIPRTDRSKKLSIPATVSCALKYIPELQKQVQKLMQRKEEILETIYKRRESILPHKQRKSTGIRNIFPVVTVNQVEGKDYVIQISTLKAKNIPLSVILQDFEKEGFHVLNASAFNSCGKMVCYNLHLQAKETGILECEMLSQQLMSLYQNQGELQSQSFNVDILRGGLQIQL